LRADRVVPVVHAALVKYVKRRPASGWGRVAFSFHGRSKRFETPKRSKADVAEHEVLMAFNGDSDALAFRDWWQEEGAVLFAEYLIREGKVHE
jgi:hypothetical protein